MPGVPATNRFESCCCEQPSAGPGPPGPLPGPGSSVKTITFALSPYTVLAGDWTLLGDATGGIVTMLLPSAVGVSGQEYRFKKVDATANVVIVQAAGGERVDGLSAFPLTGQWDAVIVVSDGSKWMVF